MYSRSAADGSYFLLPKSSRCPVTESVTSRRQVSDSAASSRASFAGMGP